MMKAAGAFAAVVVLAAACGDSPKAGTLSGKPTGSECEATQSGAASCAGLACLELKPNLQNKTGICSQRCSVATDCTAGGICVAAGPLGSLCLVPCTTSAQCVDGFVCVAASASASFCLAVPLSGGTTDAGMSDVSSDLPDARATVDAPTLWDANLPSSAPCLAGGNILYLNGDPDDPIHPGVETILDAHWILNSFLDAPVEELLFTITPPDASTGWALDFSTRPLGQALAMQRYDRATVDPSAQGLPYLSISGNQRECITGSGAFAIESLQIQAGKLLDFTATFEQHCNDGAPALRGCLHVAP